MPALRIYRKIATKIWRDKRFRARSIPEKLSILEEITLGNPPEEFAEYCGPLYRQRIPGTAMGKRRPDLYSMAWKRTRLEVIAEQGTLCRYCYVDCADDPTVDHVIAIAHGGDPLDKKNLKVCCRSCNSKKGGKEGWMNPGGAGQ